MSFEITGAEITRFNARLLLVQLLLFDGIEPFDIPTGADEIVLLPVTAIE